MGDHLPSKKRTIRLFLWLLVPLFFAFQNATPSGTTLTATGVVYKNSLGTTWDQYQISWGPQGQSNIYVNPSTHAMVIKSMDVTIHARPGLGETAIDLCAVVMNDHDNMTTNGVEDFCLDVYKTSQAADFINQIVHVNFPGQGLYMAPGSYFVFNGQGDSRSGAGALNYAADLTLSATFTDADPTISIPPVQAIRAPYIDGGFAGTLRSPLAPHTNTTDIARPILGVWTYITTHASSVTNCLGTKSSGGTWGQQCTVYDSSQTLSPGPVTMLAPSPILYAFGPGDQIASQ